MPYPTTAPSLDAPSQSMQAWVHRLRASDREAYEALFQAFHASLLRYAWRLTGCPEAAQDIVQEVFLKLWQRRALLDPKRSTRALLYTMTRNLCYNHHRARRHTPEVSAEIDQPDESADLEGQIDAAFLSRRIQHSIDRMPARRREAFLLSRLHGLSHAEIAAIMALTPRTVNAHIMLALQTLRSHLALHVEG